MTDSLSPAALERQLIAQETAKMLLEVQAVLFNPEKPFIFTSGWASPVYTDMRKIISYPRLRKRILDHNDRKRNEKVTGTGQFAGVEPARA